MGVISRLKRLWEISGTRDSRGANSSIEFREIEPVTVDELRKQAIIVDMGDPLAVFNNENDEHDKTS